LANTHSGKSIIVDLDDVNVEMICASLPLVHFRRISIVYGHPYSTMVDNAHIVLNRLARYPIFGPHREQPS
jgi:hypothetical protein